MYAGIYPFCLDFPICWSKVIIRALNALLCFRVVSCYMPMFVFISHCLESSLFIASLLTFYLTVLQKYSTLLKHSFLCFSQMYEHCFFSEAFYLFFPLPRTLPYLRQSNGLFPSMFCSVSPCSEAFFDHFV